MVTQTSGDGLPGHPSHSGWTTEDESSARGSVIDQGTGERHRSGHAKRGDLIKPGESSYTAGVHGGSLAVSCVQRLGEEITTHGVVTELGRLRQHPVGIDATED
jgi:hypothetical protein